MSRLPIVVLLLSFGACATSSAEGGWERTVVLDTDVKLGGCAIGELDPAGEGPEVAAVAGNGDVYVAWRTADGWTGEAVANVGGEMIQVAIGDADLDAPGNEIVVVGMAEGTEDSGGPGRAHVVRRTADGWRAEPILDDTALLHAVCVANGEVFAAGFSGRAHRVVHGASGWRAEPIAVLPGAAKAAVVARDGIVLACTDGSVVLVRRNGTAWSTDILHERQVGRARLGTDGERILVADDDGQVTLLHPDGTAERVWRGRDKQRGAVVADLDASVSGVELATGGYDRQVVLLRQVDGDWRADVLGEESDRVHHLAAGDVDPAPGLELIAAGFAGELVMFRRR